MRKIRWFVMVAACIAALLAPSARLSKAPKTGEWQLAPRVAFACDPGPGGGCGGG